MRPAVLFSLLLTSVGVLVADGQQPRFRSGTDTVSVYATVVDRDGHLATRLTRDDFLILDDGLPQPVTVFANEVQPIAMVVMIDRSQSVRERFDVAREAAGEFVEYLLPEDRVRIGTFSETSRLAPETFTSDREVLRRVLREDLQDAGSMTLLWNATSAAIDALTDEDGRRVLLLFTDGQDTPDPGRSLSFDQVRRQAQAEDVMVYSVGLVNERCVSLRRTPGGIRFQGGGGGRSGGRGGGRGGPAPPPRPGQIGRRPPGLPRILPPLGGTPPRTSPTEPVEETDRACSKTDPDPTLRTLADVTGGGYFELDKPKNLGPTFERIANELHHQYALAYPAPARDGKLHRIDVQVKRPGMTVRARKSYVAPAPLPRPPSTP